MRTSATGSYPGRWLRSAAASTGERRLSGRSGDRSSPPGRHQGTPPGTRSDCSWDPRPNVGTPQRPDRPRIQMVSVIAVVVVASAEGADVRCVAHARASSVPGVSGDARGRNELRRRETRDRVGVGSIVSARVTDMYERGVEDLDVQRAGCASRHVDAVEVAGGVIVLVDTARAVVGVAQCRVCRRSDRLDRVAFTLARRRVRRGCPRTAAAARSDSGSFP